MYLKLQSLFFGIGWQEPDEIIPFWYIIALSALKQQVSWLSTLYEVAVGALKLICKLGALLK